MNAISLEFDFRSAFGPNSFPASIKKLEEVHRDIYNAIYLIRSVHKKEIGYE